MTGQDIVLRVLSVIFLIAINAFFVAAEYAMVSVRRSRISQLVEAGDTQAQTVQSLQRSIDRLLSTTQLGITLSSLALGWIGEVAMADLVNHLLRQLPLNAGVMAYLSHSFSIPVAFLMIAYWQIVLGELCPKAVALLYSEQMARFLGPPIGVIARAFNPFIWILNQSTRLLLRLVGIEYTGRRWYNQVTAEELQIIIATEGESTGLEAKERALLANVFEFRDVTADEVMIPRTQLVAIAEAATFAQLLDEITANGHIRYPVKGESLDDILGLIDFQDLAQPLSQGELTLESLIAPWIKPVKFVPESMPLDELLSMMQRSQHKMVMVIDEFGGTSGLITLQDLIGKILGDGGRSDSDEKGDWQMLDEQTFLVSAQIELEELNDVLNLNLPLTDEYQTLGGFLLYQWQKIPSIGEKLIYANLEFTVVAAEGPRLLQIRFHRLLPLATIVEEETESLSKTLPLEPNEEKPS